MPVYTIGLLKDPNDVEGMYGPNPDTTPLVTVTADSPDSPVTDVQPVEGQDDMYEMANDFLGSYEGTTAHQLNRFYGMFAVLQENKE